MKPFTFQRGTDLWPDGETLLHVYALPDLNRDAELAALIHRTRAALSPWPMTTVDDDWLHITLFQVTDAPAAHYTPDELEELARELRAALARVPACTLTVGSPLSYHSGVIFDLHPDDGLTAVHDAITEVIRRVRGPDALRYDIGVPHLTMAYAADHIDSDDVQRSLRRQARPGHAPMRVDTVHLLDVACDPHHKTITWARPPIAALPLAQDGG